LLRKIDPAVNIMLENIMLETIMSEPVSEDSCMHATSDPDHVIRTPRLTLRVPTMAEFDAWCAFMADEETARFIGGVQPPPLVWRNMCMIIGAWRAEGCAMFSVFETATGRWIGRIGPWSPYGWPGREVGWGLVRDAWGRGYALEGAIAAMDFAVGRLGWSDIIHLIHPDNTASQKLAARLGSRRRGAVSMPAPYQDQSVDLWGQTAQEWSARRHQLASWAAGG
jgi:RimJ/RimL family protein N-acetyltransferase